LKKGQTGRRLKEKGQTKRIAVKGDGTIQILDRNGNLADLSNADIGNRWHGVAPIMQKE
jgi:hypothetical protein